MKAAVLTEAGKPVCICDDIDLADPRHGEVRVRIKHCGICHSDYSLATGAFPAPVPVVLGHEAAGVIDVPWKRSTRALRTWARTEAFERL